MKLAKTAGRSGVTLGGYWEDSVDAGSKASVAGLFRFRFSFVASRGCCLHKKVEY